jgi:hypothetical protein
MNCLAVKTPSFSFATISFRMLNKIENNDIFTSSFIAWLIARWEKNTAYEVVLKLTPYEN